MNKLVLGSTTNVPDGTWYAIATWDPRVRDYVDSPELGLYPTTASRELEVARAPVGRRVIRYTVSGGVVTTRRGLR